MFTVFKTIHMITITITLVMFLIRWYWKLSGSAMLDKLFVRVFPHVNDTVLLISALGAAFTSGQYPYTAPWLSAKLIALPIYIIFGYLALKKDRTQKQSAAAGAAALGVFAYIVWVAASRHPLGCAV